MTEEEFQEFRTRAVTGYAAAHVDAGNWSEDEAERIAAEETDRLLPDGVATEGMLLLVAETAADGPIGMAWVALYDPQERGPWIYDIEIFSEQRGKGYGRALLEALEREVAARGGEVLGLNVFGANAVARRLYESSGYEITSVYMRKRLTG